MSPEAEAALLVHVRTLTERLVIAEQVISGLSGEVETLLGACEGLLRRVEKIEQVATILIERDRVQ